MDGSVNSLIQFTLACFFSLIAKPGEDSGEAVFSMDVPGVRVGVWELLGVLVGVFKLFRALMGVWEVLRTLVGVLGVLEELLQKTGVLRVTGGSLELVSNSLGKARCL